MIGDGSWRAAIRATGRPAWRPAVRVAIALGLITVTIVGLCSVASYGRDYELHRGFAPVARLPDAGVGRQLKVRFFSPALHRRADYLVYLPPGYGSGRRYPVYYILHGTPGDPQVYVDLTNMGVRLDNQIRLHRASPMILVYPDGRIDGNSFSDSEWANTPTGGFENYVLEVVHDVDHRFATLRHRQDRVIAGYSEGGYAALNITLHHLADFAGVEAWSGYYLQTPTAVFTHAHRASLAYNSPLLFIRRLDRGLATHPLRVYMYVGRSDDRGMLRQQAKMYTALRWRGVSVADQVVPGGHDWATWYHRLDRMLDLASRDVTRPLPQPHLLGPEMRSAAANTITAEQPAARAHHRRASELLRLAALLLALVSAALINLGFVLQHRGQSRTPSLTAGFRHRSWLAGQAIGWVGFAGQIVAVALAPLTLVQAFSAGSLALSVPLAARLFGHRVSRSQLAAVAVIAVCLVSLPLGFAGGHGQLRAGLLIGVTLALLAAVAALLPRLGPALLAIAAGAIYGAADGAIKADAIALRLHGAGGLASGWTVLAAMCTFGGFLCFQTALRGADPVRPLSLMNGFTAITAVLLGVLAFGESLGTTPLTAVLHGAAIAIVLLCVYPLAAAQQQLAETGDSPDEGLAAPAAPRGRPRAAPTRRMDAVRALSATLLAGAALVLSVLVGTGLLYALRRGQWLPAGPSVPDALPLLQLPGLAGQPLAHVVLAWLIAGLLFGVLLVRTGSWRKVTVVAALAPLVLLLASSASYALAHNLRLGHVLLTHTPGLGGWVEGLLLAAGIALAAPVWQLRARLATSRELPSAGILLEPTGGYTPTA